MGEGVSGFNVGADQVVGAAGAAAGAAVSALTTTVLQREDLETQAEPRAERAVVWAEERAEIMILAAGEAVRDWMQDLLKFQCGGLN
jgi:hypothetical protein